MYKYLIEEKKAVLFDLDGTIADTDFLWKQAFEKILKAVGIYWIGWEELYSPNLRDRWNEVLSKDSVKAKQIKLTSKELMTQTFNEIGQLLSKSTLDVRPGFWSLIYYLKIQRALKLGLVSNSYRVPVEMLLNALGIHETFDLIITGEDVKKTKPNPEIYLTAAKKLGVKPQEALVFEDSTYGAVSAVRAGMDTILIYNGGLPKSYYPREVKLFLPDFTDLPRSFETFAEEDIKKAAAATLEEQKQGEKTGDE